MKKLVLLLMCVVSVSTIKAQNIGFDENSKFGMSANGVFTYNRGNQPFGVGLQFAIQKIIVDGTYVFGDDDDWSASVGYKFNLTERINAYPLLGVFGWKQADGDYDFKFHFGAGVNYHLSKNLFLNGRVTRRDIGVGIGFYI